MSIKKFLWDLFPLFYQEYDTYKDQESKGVLQRFVENFGIEVDDEVLKYLDENQDEYFLKNIQALESDNKFLPILKDILGNPPGILEGEEHRKMLQYIVPIYKIKGTHLSYKLFLNLLGFDVEIIEHDPLDSISEITDEIITYDFDTPIDYDKGFLYDSFLGESEIGCPYCSDYSLLLGSTQVALTQDVMDKIKQIIVFIEPINAVLREILFGIDPYSDTLALCFKQDVRISVVDLPLYDLDTPLLYDETLLYDSDNEMSQIIVSLDCEGGPQEEGIGYWSIEGTQIIE